MLRSAPIGPEADHLPDGRRAYWQETDFDCLRAVLATVLQRDPAELPEMPEYDGHSRPAQLDAEARLHIWLHEQGWRIRYRDLDAAPFPGAWIGVSVDPRPGFDHCVVFLDDTLVFNPALRLTPPPGMEHEAITTVHYAITLERTDP